MDEDVKNFRITAGDLADWFAKFPRDTPVYLDHDGWQIYEDGQSVEDTLGQVFDTHDRGDSTGLHIIINN